VSRRRAAAQCPNEAITTNFEQAIANCMTDGDIGRIP
jgi:hypothetical protein